MKVLYLFWCLFICGLLISYNRAGTIMLDSGDGGSSGSGSYGRGWGSGGGGYHK